MKYPFLTEELIAKYFFEERVSYSKHFIVEMQEEDLGEITVDELVEAASVCEILNTYPEDKPYPSVLVLGFIKTKRPLHFVCAWDENRDIIVLITIYEPRKDLWNNNRGRRTE